MLSLKKLYQFKKRWDPWHWWSVVLIVTIIRLVLCGRDEIVPDANDAQNYARLSMHYLSVPYFPPQRPGLGIFAMMAGAMGVPYKFLLDGLLILTAFFAGSLIRKISSSVTLGLLLYILIIFSPWFINTSQRFMPEPITSLFLLGLVVFAAHWMMRPVRKWSVWDALVGGLVSTAYIITRPETAIVYFFWGLTLVVGWCLNRQSISRLSRRRFLKIATLAILPLVMVFVATAVVKQIHFQWLGVAAMSATEASGEMKLLSALYSVPPEKEIRFVPVTRKTLELVCNECPTLEKHKAILLDTSNGNYRHFANALGVEKEVGTWLNWLLMNSFKGMSKDANAEMLKAVGEIRQAQAEGRLGYRIAKFPFDPCWRQWTPEVPALVAKGIRRGVHPNLNYPLGVEHVFQRINEMDVLAAGDFKDGLRLRHGAMPNDEIRISGSLFADSCAFNQVQFQTSKQRVLGTASIEKKQAGWFKINFLASSMRLDADEELMIGFRSNLDPKEDQLKIYSMNDPQTPWIVVMTDQPVNGKTVNERWVFRVNVPHAGELRPVIKAEIREHYFLGMWLTVGISFFIGCIKFVSSRHLKKVIATLIICGTFLLARTGFYALIEAWMHWGIFRYIEPNHLATMFVMVLFAFAMGASCRRWLGYTRRRFNSAVEPA